VSAVAAEYLVEPKQISIAISIEGEVAENKGKANPILLRYVVDEFSLTIRKAKHRWIIRVVKLIVETSHQIAEIAFASGEEISSAAAGKRTIDNAAQSTQSRRETPG